MLNHWDCHLAQMRDNPTDGILHFCQALLPVSRRHTPLEWPPSGDHRETIQNETLKRERQNVTGSCTERNKHTLHKLNASRSLTWLSQSLPRHPGILLHSFACSFWILSFFSHRVKSCGVILKSSWIWIMLLQNIVSVWERKRKCEISSSIPYASRHFLTQQTDGFEMSKTSKQICHTLDFSHILATDFTEVPVCVFILQRFI